VERHHARRPRRHRVGGVRGGTTNKIFPVTQWRSNLFTRTFFDSNGDGVSQPDELGSRW